MVLWDTSPPSSRSAGFPSKVTIPCPNNLSLELLACHAAGSTSLDAVTIGHFHIRLFDFHPDQKTERKLSL